ncbi:MAG: AAA domain-containing protein [Chloroflexi bacterium]|nr:AAA domain-containing protein [Chloroflexota bacterium]
MPIVYPFTAIVGQEDLKRALLLSAVDPGLGGVLIRGERGSGKSTAARALAALLPPLRVVRGCRFHCDPDRPETWCTECQARAAQGETLTAEEIPAPFVNLPLAATEERVVGTLDIEQALQAGRRQFQPGLLAAAHRGVLYIDEVNLLEDHLVDLLLDVAAMGINYVEREGVSFQHPARFVLVGSMNPEEGDLRPQLLDRFALVVDVRGVSNPLLRAQIMERHLAFEQDPAGFYAEWAPREQALRARIEAARRRLAQVRYSEEDLLTIAGLTTRFGVEGHRADLVILRAARAQAALEGRDSLTADDILAAAALALPHRLKRDPLETVTLDFQALQEALAQAREQSARWQRLGQKQPAASEEAAKKAPRAGSPRAIPPTA